MICFNLLNSASKKEPAFLATWLVRSNAPIPKILLLHKHSIPDALAKKKNQLSQTGIKIGAAVIKIFITSAKSIMLLWFKFSRFTILMHTQNTKLQKEIGINQEYNSKGIPAIMSIVRLTEICAKAIKEM